MEKINPEDYLKSVFAQAPYLTIKEEFNNYYHGILNYPLFEIRGEWENSEEAFSLNHLLRKLSKL